MNITAITTPELVDLRERGFKPRGRDIRFVGGGPRDFLRGEIPKDIDLCTDATPDEQIEIYQALGLRYIETGLQHGTITVVMNGEPYEITSLRVETDHDGRHATVTYTNDWLADLGRRDLTINAISITFDGQIIDPFGGVEDLKNGVVRFVGSPGERMREDYLRILRFFRFHGRFASDKPLDQATVEAIVINARGLENISRERVWSEMYKIVTGPASAALIDSMYDLGVATHIDLPMGSIKALDACQSTDPITRMVALLKTHMNIRAMASKWRWSGDDRDLGLFLSNNHGQGTLSNPLDTYKTHMAYSLKPKAWVLELALLNGHADLVPELRDWEIPVCPVRGQDLLDAGIPQSPLIGKMVAIMRRLWMESGFTATKDYLMNIKFNTYE